MEPIHIREIKGRKLEDLSPNELRVICYKMGIDIPASIRTKEELVRLVKAHS